MKSALHPFLLCILLAPALSVAADGAGEGRRALDLSLPRDALSGTWSLPPAGNATPLPDLGGPRLGNYGSAQRGGGHRTDLPYGAGYEARQGGGGGGGGGGHGRGGGRGR